MSDLNPNVPPPPVKVIREQRERARQRRMNLLTIYVTITSTVIALAAAAAAFWSGYEAHKTRIEDERPFLAVEITTLASDAPSFLVYNGDESPDGPILTTILASGKSAARNVRVTCATLLRDQRYKVLWKDIDPKIGVRHFPFILPSRSAIIACPVQKATAQDWASTNAAPYWVGTQLGLVQYTGTDKTEYQTPFCFDIKVRSTDNYMSVQPCERGFGLPDLK